MKSIIKKSLQGLLLVPALALGVVMVAPAVVPSDAYAQVERGLRGGANAAQGDGQVGSEETGFFDPDGMFERIVNAFLFIIGAVAVIMLVYGGFRYVTSGGDASAVTAAKNTILYAVIGIIVAILAYAIVDFVVDQFSGGTTGVSSSIDPGVGN